MGNPLISRPDVICTPHLGASTVEAQEDVAIEIAEAVVDALQVYSAITPACSHALHPQMLDPLIYWYWLSQRPRDDG